MSNVMNQKCNFVVMREKLTAQKPCNWQTVKMNLLSIKYKVARAGQDIVVSIDGSTLQLKNIVESENEFVYYVEYKYLFQKDI
jgi:hypothetical protein